MLVMKRFWFKLACLAALPLLVLSVLHGVVDTGLRQSRHPLYAEWNDLFNAKIQADMLILGSSRAAFHISPYILDTTLRLNSYNLGMSAWRLDMQLTRFKLYLAHNPKPKYIIHNVDVYGFRKRKDLIDYQQFLPYINEPLLQANFTGLKGNFSYVQRYIPLYKYANDYELIWEGIKNYTHVFEPLQTEKHKGFKANDLPWDNKFGAFKKKYPKGVKYPIEPDLQQAFFEYLAFCRKQGIQVILVYAPEYYEVQPLYKNKKAFVALCQKAQQQYGCMFLDYTNDSLCFKQNLFYNSQHLNKTGANLFSVKLAQDLKRIVLHSNR